MADQSIVPLNLQGTPNCVAPTAAVDVAIGSPLYASAANAANLAKGDVIGTGHVIGLAVRFAAANEPVLARFAGPLELTTDEWDARVTGAEGGLTPGSTYYLSAANAGKLVTTVPVATGNVGVQVGIALSTTVLNVAICPALVAHA